MVCKSDHCESVLQKTNNLVLDSACEPSFAEPLESVAFFESFVLQIGDGFLHNSILFNSHISDAGGWFSH